MPAENTTAKGPLRPVPPARSEGMPLGCRRLLMIGGICIPGGLVAGPYLLPAQLVAVAGIILLALALSYGPGQRWFWRWSLAVALTGGLWLAATAAYYVTIMTAAEASAPLPAFAQVLFTAGAVCFAVMAVATLTGSALRILAGRRRVREAGAASRP
ncbi:hypothetical protein [Arthrobacter sp. Leaf137]|uniref:hypothetical protein n=1 Tax=Arthrobacter sp. Leaf137 TaxID=1736271 RepID=UPI0006FD72BC|nr:hypothetical protein [Arthrobacter sp. Leaf137]KQQ80924.1 hypothetical protein ASF64_12835 [Arthrobacter sp. Leaf137]